MEMLNFSKMLLAGGSMLSLASCFAAPGTFTSDLTLLSNGQYEFVYDGEVKLMTLSMMMKEIAESESGEFTPYCEGPTGDEDEYGSEIYGERDCTPDEIDEQLADYEERKAEQIRESAEIRAAMGGIDPSDEKSIQAFTDRMERQAGWESVRHTGDGMFQVRYHSKGQLPDDFGFPLIKDVPAGQPFLTVARWDDGSVRVDAPLFAPQATGTSGLMGAAMMGGLGGMGGDDTGFDLPKAKGTFTIRTDGDILTNHSETGPAVENGV